MAKQKLIYLASPYSDPNPAVMEERFEIASYMAGMIMRYTQIPIFSPIAHSHPIAKHYGLPTDWGFWEQFDRAILKACSGLFVLMIAGWRASRGVSEEIRIASEMGLPIWHLGPWPSKDHIVHGQLKGIMNEIAAQEALGDA